jgi:hypothetical protein
MNELPRGIDPTQAPASDGGCPARIYPLRRPEGHTPPIPRYSAVLPQQDKVAVLFMGVQALDAEALREAAFAQLPGTAGDIAPVYADFAGFTDPQGYLNQVAALYWLKAKDFSAWSKLPEVVEWRARLRPPRAPAIGARRATAFPPQPMICSKGLTLPRTRNRARQEFPIARFSRRRT